MTTATITSPLNLGRLTAAALLSGLITASGIAGIAWAEAPALVMHYTALERSAAPRARALQTQQGVVLPCANRRSSVSTL